MYIYISGSPCTGAQACVCSVCVCKLCLHTSLSRSQGPRLRLTRPYYRPSQQPGRIVVTPHPRVRAPALHLQGPGRKWGPLESPVMAYCDGSAGRTGRFTVGGRGPATPCGGRSAPARPRLPIHTGGERPKVRLGKQEGPYFNR